MPTTLPLDPGDDVGGPLKPIAQFHDTPAPAAPAPAPAAARPAAQAAAPVAAVSKPTSATAPSRPATPSFAGGPLRTTLGPGLSLHPQHHAAKAAAATQVKPKRQKPFSDADFSDAWQQFIAANGSMQLLVNTMRAHPAARAAAETDTAKTDNLPTVRFAMAVDSEIQQQLMEDNMSTVLDFLSNRLENDDITIDITVHHGPTSPQTWTQKEILADLQKRIPDLDAFIDKLGLSLE